VTPGTPSILLAAPGHDLAPGHGSTQHVLALAGSLSRRTRLTVAFRRVGAEAGADGVAFEAIDPTAAEPEPDGVGVRGLDPRPHLAYLSALRRFARRARRRFDALLEVGSRLSGVLGGAFAAPGRPYMAIEPFRPLVDAGGDARALIRRIAHGVGESIVRRRLRLAARVFVESRDFGADLVRGGYVRARSVRILPTGVDRNRFRPQDRLEARRALGVAESALVLLFAGSLDEYHELEPVLRAAAAHRRNGRGSSLEVHLVGEGRRREWLERCAAETGAPARFHGRVPPDAVPRWIAAADLALAPYRTDGFPGGRVPFSTLKIPEYLACARPVVTVPWGGPAERVRSGVDGFLVPNREAAWTAFLDRLPSREALDEMGRRATESPLPSWDDVAATLLEACEEARR